MPRPTPEQALEFTKKRLDRSERKNAATNKSVVRLAAEVRRLKWENQALTGQLAWRKSTNGQLENEFLKDRLKLITEIAAANDVTGWANRDDAQELTKKGRHAR